MVAPALSLTSNHSCPRFDLLALETTKGILCSVFFFFFSEEGVEGCCRMGGNSLLSSQKESKTNCKKMFKWICTLMREARGGEGGGGEEN